VKYRATFDVDPRCGPPRMNTDEELAQKLISPNGFDGRGPVPEKVVDAAKTLARLRVKFVSQWMPGADSPLTAREVDQLFDAALLQSEWVREVTEARDSALAVVKAAQEWKRADDEWGAGGDVIPAFALDGVRAALDAWEAG
jgi:hypothetical protein